MFLCVFLYVCLRWVPGGVGRNRLTANRANEEALRLERREEGPYEASSMEIKEFAIERTPLEE